MHEILIISIKKVFLFERDCSNIVVLGFGYKFIKIKRISIMYKICLLFELG